MRVSPKWKRLGFQQQDPATDFRGGGVLGLKCLLYYAEKHTEHVSNGLCARLEYSSHMSPLL